jgi:hypothetical protein
MTEWGSVSAVTPASDSEVSPSRLLDGLISPERLLHEARRHGPEGQQ